MVQIAVVNDQGVLLCRLGVPPTATVQYLLNLLLVAKPEALQGAQTLRNDVRNAALVVADGSGNTALTLVQAGLMAADSLNETLVLSNTSSSQAPPAAPTAATVTASSSGGTSAPQSATTTATPTAMTSVNPPTPPATDARQRILDLFNSGSSPTAAAAAALNTNHAAEVAARRAFEEELQRHIYERAQQQRIDENLRYALEYTPEAFATVNMLYVSCAIDNVPIKAFVDTGAEKSIMTVATAERCGLLPLVDRRCGGVAIGVGHQKIVGRIHITPVSIGGLSIPCSFSVLEQNTLDVIIGLDQLKRHQMLIDLRENCLVIDTVRVPFLPESEIPKRDHSALLALADGGVETRAEEDTAVARSTAATAAGGGDSGGGATPQPPQQTPSPAPAPIRATPPVAAATAEAEASSQEPIPAPLLSPATSTTASPVAEDEGRAARVQGFMAFTGISDATQAAELLEAAGWDPDTAAALYFDDD